MRGLESKTNISLMNTLGVLLYTRTVVVKREIKLHINMSIPTTKLAEKKVGRNWPAPVLEVVVVAVDRARDRHITLKFAIPLSRRVKLSNPTTMSPSIHATRLVEKGKLLLLQ